jgi:NADH dehydrogenase/NADH:ubiquinone oxidoreductase subunit G
MINLEKTLTITINGKKIKADGEQTILEAAEQNNIYIPTLCFNKDLVGISLCRVCAVEVENADRLQPACVTRVREDMIIKTDSPRVIQARKTNLKLILANHADNCLVCDTANLCELREIAAESGVANSFYVKSRTARMIDNVHPYIQRDLSKCVTCRRCVRACREIAKKDLWTVAYRGHNTRIVINNDSDFSMEICKDCTVCADICPVGALINTSKERTAKQLCSFSEILNAD